MKNILCYCVRKWQVLANLVTYSYHHLKIYISILMDFFVFVFCNLFLFCDCVLLQIFVVFLSQCVLYILVTLYVYNYICSYIHMLCILQPICTKGLLRISFTELTSCLNITITVTITVQLPFLMVLEQNHKYTAQTYIASHPECCKVV